MLGKCKTCVCCGKAAQIKASCVSPRACLELEQEAGPRPLRPLSPSCGEESYRVDMRCTSGETLQQLVFKKYILSSVTGLKLGGEIPVI